MEKIAINTVSGHSEIHIGTDWKLVAGLIPESGTVIVTDDNVQNLFGELFPGVPVISILPGEESKKLQVIEELSVKLLDLGTDRSGFILGIGGGVVCDIAGFLASVYMRGIRCAYISTSLLSQVDASTGGKTGVNLGGTKNIIGSIRQPEFVICDQTMLASLPEDEYLSGLAEVVKTAIIGDKQLFGMIENNYDRILRRDISILTEIISSCVRFKAGVVAEDENENGLRRILNFGHTFGHAIEMHESMKHGFAVAAGMEIATEFSYEKGLINNEDRNRIIEMINKFGLLGSINIREDKIRELILHDKKKSGKGINFVFTGGIGKASVKMVSVDELTDFYKKFRDKKRHI